MSDPIAPADILSPTGLGPSATFVSAPGTLGVFANYRVTEDGQARITEDGQVVELEEELT